MPTLTALAPLDHFESRSALEAERSLMWRLGGSCALPLGAYRHRERRPHRDAGGRHRPRRFSDRAGRGGVRLPEGAAALATKALIAEGAEEILEALEDEALGDEAGDDRG